MTIDRSKFFAGVRSFLKSQGLTLTQKRVDALEFLVSSFEKTDWPITWIAYAFATIFHETAHTFEPIYEKGQRSYFDKYEPNTRIGKNLGNTQKGDGYRYRGAGLIQITGRANFRKFGIENDPEAAIRPKTAFEIMRHGMEFGVFTGKKLSDFVFGKITDYKSARRVINGTDKAKQIAEYAKDFESILDDSYISVTETAKTPAFDPKSARKDAVPLTDNPSPIDQVHVDKIENVTVEDPKPLPTGEQTVPKEKADPWTRILAIFATITGMGFNVAAMIEKRIDAMSGKQLAVMGGVTVVVAVAIWAWHRSGERANQRTLKLIDVAADPSQNSVKLEDGK